MQRKIPRIACFVGLLLIVSCFLCIGVFASESTGDIVVRLDNTDAFPGEEIEVNATISGNPGIMSAALKVEYDAGLVLIDAENGPAFEGMMMTKTDLSSGSKFVWESRSEASTSDGVILSLRFRVSETMLTGDTLSVSASYVDGEIIDSYLNPIDVTIVPSRVSIYDYLPGDLNNDSVVNVKDVIWLRKFISGEDVPSLNTSAADVDGNGKNNITDLLLLRRFIVGGYGIKLKYPKPEATGKEYTITYHLDDGDPYLQSITIENPYPDTYHSGETVPLSFLTVDGYKFEGWFDGPSASATEVKSISSTDTGNKELYARWTPYVYTVQFDSPWYPVDSITYTTDKGATLGADPTLSGYVFTGWTDENNNLVTRIEKGTFGNIILHANWASKRNQVRPVSSLSDPVIYYDEDLNCIQFAYEIGTIENVPLYEIEYLGNKADGISYTKTTTSSGSISQSTADSVANVVSDATTNSNTWTLSKDWNVTVLDSSTHESESGSSTTDESESGSEYESESEHTSSGGGSHNTTTGGSLSLKIGNNNQASFLDGGITRILGVNIEAGGEVHNDVEDKRTWNSEDGHKATNKTTSNEKHIKTLNSKIADSSTHSFSRSDGGSETSSTSTATTHSNTHECASSFTYSTQETQTSTIQYSNANAPEGYYRVVCAGTLVVYAVVNYDIATKTYGVFTYSLLEDETKDFLDYSKVSSKFNDNMNGVLPFEVPIFVNNYVDSVVGGAERSGFVVDLDTGTIVDYSGTNTDVIIPEYVTVENDAGAADVTKVTGIDSAAFAGKNITSISLSENIESIPDNAFKNCTSLKTVKAPGVKRIGASAFAGCSSLNDYSIQSVVTAVGENAFEGANKITAVAGNADVVKAIALSGAENIRIDISQLGSELNDNRIEVPDTADFVEIYGGGHTYTNLRIVSDAKETVINRVSIIQASAPGLKITSPKVTLNRVSVESSTWAMMLGADLTEISLYGTIQMKSSSEDAVLCKSISLKRLNSNVVGKLNVTGNLLICGEVENDNLRTFTSGAQSSIDENRFTVLWNNSWSDWSDWSESPIEANSDREVETLVQYRYADKQTTSSTNSSMSGWTQTGSSVSYGNWGAWSSWNRGSMASSDTRNVETATVYGYYYFRCPNCGAHMHGYPTCYKWADGCGASSMSLANAVNVFDPTPWASANCYEFHGTGKYATDALTAYGRLFQWSDNGVNSWAGYRYRDRSKTITYSYERWGGWSNWSETVYSSSSTRKVETRTLYRSRTRQ